MTPALMSPVVRAELSGLSSITKAQVVAWLNNQMQIALSLNGNESEDIKLPRAVRENARIRERYVAEFKQQVDKVFALNPNGSLGATSDDDERFVEERSAL